MSIKKAREELRRTASALGRFAAEAATSGNFDETIAIARWAEAIAGLVSLGPENSVAKLPDPLVVPLRGGSKPRRSSSQYPKFRRQAESLVKVAWSKKERKEYEQKAPKKVIDHVALDLARRGANSDIVAVDQIVPLIGAEDGREVPSYQVYVVLAWLRALELVEVVGRQGYRLKVANIIERVQVSWAAL
jgi:hypothetical protein